MPRQAKASTGFSTLAAQVGAAPDCPAGHFSPYSDGEKDAATNGFANCLGSRMRRRPRDQPLLPVTIRGEGAGRRM
ncbi:MAG: hypothetical protein EOS45_19935, partial [Mesorhizobium sp.]